MTWKLYEDDAPTVSGLDHEIIDAVSAKEPWTLVERFAELERVSGTPDEREAATHLTDRLATHDVPHETYEPELYLSTPHSAAIETDEWTSETAKTVSFSNSKSVKGELVYAENDDEMASIEAMLSVSLADVDDNLEGKVVMAESIIPITAIEELADRGAEGFIGIHPHEREPHEGIVTPVWGGASPLSERARQPNLPVANVSRAEGEHLIELARDGVKVTVTCETSTRWTNCPLVRARIPGEAAPKTDEFVLLHGHYDSWHVGVTDNATGDATLLEAARVLYKHRMKLRRDVWVAWWPGHSTGRYAGSTWFADEFATELAELCIAHVNVDSPGVADATEFDSRVKWMPSVHSVAATAIEDVTGKETIQKRPPRAGDYSFNNLGIPGMSLQSSIPESVLEERGHHPVGGSGGNSDAWHLTTDTLEKANEDVLVRDTQVYTVATARLSAAVDSPLNPLRTIDHHRDIVDEYDQLSEFDLKPVLSALDDLWEATVQALDDGLSSNKVSSLVGTLTRLNFTSEGQFEQDPAVSRPPYPRLAPVDRLDDLDGAERKFLELELRRARNTVVAQLREASRRIK